jgi:hypothetical protein
MKRIIKKHGYYFKFFFIILFFVFLSACNGIKPAEPVIHSFAPDVYVLEEGDSAILSWSVTDADTVTINQGIGNVSLSGSTSVTPTETTTYTLTAINNAGTSTAIFTITVNPVFIIIQTITIQPGQAKGKDAMVICDDESGPNNNNFGDKDDLFIGNNPDFDAVARAYLQFDLSEIPNNAVIVSACLKLYQAKTGGSEGFIISVHRVSQSWQEDTITWNNQPNYHNMPESTTSVILGEETWLSWDITTLLLEWLDGSTVNYGVVLKDTDEASVHSYITCHSSEYGFTPKCPKLDINYYIP